MQIFHLIKDEWTFQFHEMTSKHRERPRPSHKKARQFKFAHAQWITSRLTTLLIRFTCFRHDSYAKHPPSLRTLMMWRYCFTGLRSLVEQSGTTMRTVSVSAYSPPHRDARRFTEPTQDHHFRSTNKLQRGPRPAHCSLQGSHAPKSHDEH